MKMTPLVIIAGGVMIIGVVLLIVVFLPWATISDKPSEIFRPRTAGEERGRELFLANGCFYCHTQFVRNIDWGHGAVRVAHPGDYIQDRPHILGTERTGPDLSQEGGIRPDDWHVAHFMNPRYTRPASLMPIFAFLGREKTDLLTAYMQSLGFKQADFRAARQKSWKEKEIRAYEAGPAKNVEWLHSMIPEGWRNVPNPYPLSPESVSRGQRVYQQFCIGCHGSIGDGMGPAAPFLYPPPLNFTILQNRGISGGILYYQIMNGITGTAMMYFKDDLESAKIWDVGKYVATHFIGQSDANTPPKGIDAAYETPPAAPEAKEEKK